MLENLIVSRLTALFALTLAATISESALAIELEPQRADQSSFITRAVFADRRLWLLSDAGTLSSITEGDDKQLEIALPEPALDLWVEGGQPAVITCKRVGCSNWSLRQRIDDQWPSKIRIPTQNDSFAAIAHAAATVTLLTSRRIIDVVGDRQSAAPLAGPEQLRTKPITSALAASGGLFVGFNAGEWGGGLQRIDRKTGKITTIESNTSGQLCGGPLSTGCDPVTGIALSPWNSDCIAVAVGLVHLLTRGRIVEICGDVIRLLYPQRDELLFSYVPFFGLARDTDALWTSSEGHGIYRIGQDGAAQMTPLPTFKRIGRVFVSFDFLSFVLVRTGDQRRLLGGSEAIIASR